MKINLHKNSNFTVQMNFEAKAKSNFTSYKLISIPIRTMGQDFLKLALVADRMLDNTMVNSGEINKIL